MTLDVEAALTMLAAAGDPFDEIFSHDLDGVIRHFNTTRMRKYIEAHPNKAKRQLSYLSHELVSHIVNSHGVEQRKVVRLAQRPDIVVQPPIGIVWECGSVTIIDGNHRIVLQYMNGVREIDVWMVSLRFAERFMVDIPESERITRKLLGKSDQ